MRYFASFVVVAEPGALPIIFGCIYHGRCRMPHGFGRRISSSTKPLEGGGVRCRSTDCHASLSRSVAFILAYVMKTRRIAVCGGRCAVQVEAGRRLARGFVRFAADRVREGAWTVRRLLPAGIDVVDCCFCDRTGYTQLRPILPVLRQFVA